MMNCKNPYVHKGTPYGCGQCLPCRINRRRLWTHRIMLECYDNSLASFITLTYDPKQIPPGGSLNPTDTTQWLKRIRKYVQPKFLCYKPVKLRYFLVGEYGERTFRPHYHLALFGFPSCQYTIPQQLHGSVCRCPNCQIIYKTWGKGITFNGTLTFDSAQYVAQYVTKKITNENSSAYDGEYPRKYPEFCRMSNRPGIGANSLDKIVEFLKSPHGVNYIQQNGDVPSVLKHGGKQYPLGRYLKSVLRKKLGSDGTTPNQILKELHKINEAELLNFVDETDFYGSSSDAFAAMSKQNVLNVESKYEIHNSRSKKL